MKGKRSFVSEQKAVEFEKSNREQYDNPPQYAYPCEDCPAWHLASAPNGNSRIAKAHFPSVPQEPMKVDDPEFKKPEPDTKKKGPAGVETAQVIQMRSEGKTLDQIANHFGVTTGTVQYHLNKTSTPHIRPKNVVSLDAVAKKKAELEATQKLLLEQMARLQAEEERLLENTKMKFDFVQTEQGEVIVIKKNEEEITLTAADIVQLSEAVQQHEVSV